MKKFSLKVSDHLLHYVYRLVDPRNGETFYVGKGKANRVFQHMAGEKLSSDEDDTSEKIKRIREIHRLGLEVLPIIHRHGLDEKTAFEIEAALLDAYFGTTNISGGHHSDERGVMHPEELIIRYEAQVADFDPNTPILMINVNKSIEERSSILEAVRYSWKVSLSKARQAKYVLAVQQGLIVGAFEPQEWYKATPENFPGLSEERAKRFGFVGKEAPSAIKEKYIGKRVPDAYRKRGSANPIKYSY
ncbi:MAG: hypothetical protein DI626_01370 [Micavibrio aeruginosavorus]|uniref:GIY-YIG domain-containing protein n=1 Tax=Micavibrio aeruginosavorus TaxID=349221 RepID=A0A2W5A611_9BACT|nr:MAG: hypothetical protein DI626_01370 [Micavibrio aeruginosavorus]